MRLGLTLAGLVIMLAACRPGATPTLEPIASQVAQRLTQTAAVARDTPAATPTASPMVQPTGSPTPPMSLTPAVTPSATVTPTPSATATPTSAPRATVPLGSLPRPPSTFAGDSHFLFSDPGLGFIASSYRYGSVGIGQRFAPHHGADFSAPAGAPIGAVAAGTIYYAGNDLDRQFGPQKNFYGNLVVIQLAQGWNGHTIYALYGHLNQVAVQTGQPVNAGDVLGTVGATGVALGPHPHLEAREDKPDSYLDTRNPELWLQPLAGTGTLALRVTNASGNFLPGVRVNFVCADGAPRYLETYWYSGVNPDDVYGENAAMMGLPPGFCHFQADIAGEHVEFKDGLIKPGAVGFVWIKTKQ
jgi:murein DD-endopeptidase MepM/ murein hydrolase activator NlpD